MLRDATTSGITKIYIACGFTDLRRGIDGLSYLVQERFDLDPLERGTLFLFCGRKSDRIKGLLFEGDGFLLLYKRLVPGFRFQWPRNAQEARELTAEQYAYLMKGFNPLQPGLIEDVYPSRLG
ncbi:MAG: IS66 family insertion sequence element accessory protein TnpB [Blautia sp.]|nr:IS66 family insertion sequence element accessory protein TnpB [Blautia sp.]